MASHARNPALLSLPTSARARWLPVLGMGHAFEHTVHSTLTQGVMGASLRSYTGVFSKWLHNVLVPERLRGLTRNQLGSACAGSSPAEHDVFEKKKECDTRFLKKKSPVFTKRSADVSWSSSDLKKDVTPKPCSVLTKRSETDVSWSSSDLAKTWRPAKTWRALRKTGACSAGLQSAERKKRKAGRRSGFQRRSLWFTQAMTVHTAPSKKLVESADHREPFFS